MTLVAVAPHRHALGVQAPDGATTFDWREPVGSAGNTAEIAALYQVSDLGNALADVHAVDAHLVAYVARDEKASPFRAQPRVNKSGLEWFRSLGYDLAVEVLLADVDNPGHVPWTPALRAEFDGLRYKARALSTAGIYMTAHGLRIVQPLTRAVSVERAEACLRVWLAELEASGLRVDHSCRDWTRHYRAPNVLRGGRPQRAELLVQAAGMKPIDPPATAAPAQASRAPRARRAEAVVCSRELPPTWDDHVAQLAAPIRINGYVGQRHALFLALAGALCGRKVPPELVPIICASVAAIAGTDTDAAWTRGQSTVDRWAAGDRVAGARALGDIAPHVRAVVDEVTRPRAARVRAQGAANDGPVESLEEVTVRLVQAMRDAPDGVTLIRAQCGLGKTRAASIVALERAARTHATPGEHTRAPRGSKTAISVPTSALARELVARLRAEGLDAIGVLQRFGPLAMMSEDPERRGQRECRFADTAGPLASGGQSVPRSFCDGRHPCEHRSDCRAYGGRDGPDDARIAVGPHAMIGELAAFAGSSGLLVIDEPPAMLVSETLTAPMLERALGRLANFETRYAAAMAPVVKAAAVWLGDKGAPDYVGPLSGAHACLATIDPELADAAFAMTAQTDAISSAQAAFDPTGKATSTPPIKQGSLFRLRVDAAMARSIGEASKVLRTMWMACTAKGATVRLETRKGGRALVCTWVDEAYRAALSREGPTLALDANADLHAPVMTSVLGYSPKLLDFAAPDGAPIARTLYQLSGANRRGWMAEAGQLVATPQLQAAVKVVDAWCGEQAVVVGVGVITTKPLKMALQAACGLDVVDAWVKDGRSPADLATAAEALRPHVDKMSKCVVAWGHYGGMRGIDAWKGLGALVTIGDPWQNVGDLQHEADFLRLPDWEGRAEALCRAELEQAHGRLRTVHRTTPARMLHVGSVLPGGWPTFARRGPADGRRANVAAMPLSELREAVVAAGGPSLASEAWRMNRSTLKRYLSGERAVPPPQAEVIRLHVASHATIAAE